MTKERKEEAYTGEINACMGVPNWNSCRWRDNNTLVCKENLKYILCHTQCKDHRCERLLRVNIQDKREEL